MIGNLCRDDRLGKLADDGELIAEVAVQRFEPLRQFDDSLAACVGGDGAVVHRLHVGGYDCGMRKEFVRRFERVIDLYNAVARANLSGGKNIADKIAGLLVKAAASRASRNAYDSEAADGAIPSLKNSPGTPVAPASAVSGDAGAAKTRTGCGIAAAGVNVLAIGPTLARSAARIRRLHVHRGIGIGRANNCELRSGILGSNANLPALKHGHAWRVVGVEVEAVFGKTNGPVGSDALAAAAGAKEQARSRATGILAQDVGIERGPGCCSGDREIAGDIGVALEPDGAGSS